MPLMNACSNPAPWLPTSISRIDTMVKPLNKKTPSLRSGLVAGTLRMNWNPYDAQMRVN